MELFDLALIWAFIIGFGVIMYVLMDGLIWVWESCSPSPRLRPTATP